MNTIGLKAYRPSRFGMPVSSDDETTSAKELRIELYSELVLRQEPLFGSEEPHAVTPGRSVCGGKEAG